MERAEPEDSNSSSNASDDTDNGYGRMENALRHMIRVITNTGREALSIAEDMESETDSDDTAESGEIPFYYRSPPPVCSDTKPDTSRIEENEIQLLTDVGVSITSKERGRHPYSRNIYNSIIDRQLGLANRSKTKRKLCCNLLPDTHSKVASFRNKVFCGFYGREGDIFVSASQDRTIRIFCTRGERFKLLQTIKARDVGWSVLDVSLSPDGTHLVYSSWNDYLYQVPILADNYQDEGHSVEQTPLRLDPPGHHQFCIFSVRFSEDSTELVGGANDGCIYLYDRQAESQNLRIGAHDSDVNAVCFVDQTTQIVASGGDDGLCKVWDRRSLRESNPLPVGVLAGHRDGIAYLDSRGDGRYIISNSKDQTIKLWDIRQFSPSSYIQKNKKSLRHNSWDYRWEKVPKSVRKEWTKSNESDSSVMTYSGHAVLQTLVRCRFSPQFTTGQRYIYTGCASGRVVIYDVLTGEIVQSLHGHRACVRDVSWHPYLPHLVSSSWDFTINKWQHKGVLKEEYFDWAKKKTTSANHEENSAKRSRV